MLDSEVTTMNKGNDYGNCTFDHVTKNNPGATDSQSKTRDGLRNKTEEYATDQQVFQKTVESGIRASARVSPFIASSYAAEVSSYAHGLRRGVYGLGHGAGYGIGHGPAYELCLGGTEHIYCPEEKSINTALNGLGHGVFYKIKYNSESGNCKALNY